jgi:hypothetical protein
MKDNIIRLIKWQVAFALCFILLGCARKETPADESVRILNEPRTREEAIQLMAAVTSDARTNDWSPEVARDFKRRMKSRLITAGLKEAQVDSWIGRPFSTNPD